MAGKNAIQILRANSATIANSSETLLDGQLLYNTDKNYLTCGGGADKPVNSLPVVCQELAFYQGDADRISANTGDDYLVYRIGPNKLVNKLEIYSNSNIALNTTSSILMNAQNGNVNIFGSGMNASFGAGGAHINTSSGIYLNDGSSTLDLGSATANLSSERTLISGNIFTNIRSGNTSLNLSSGGVNIYACTALLAPSVNISGMPGVQICGNGSQVLIMNGISIYSPTSIRIATNSLSSDIYIDPVDGQKYYSKLKINAPSFSTIAGPAFLWINTSYNSTASNYTSHLQSSSVALLNSSVSQFRRYFYFPNGSGTPTNGLLETQVFYNVNLSGTYSGIAFTFKSPIPYWPMQNGMFNSAYNVCSLLYGSGFTSSDRAFRWPGSAPGYNGYIFLYATSNSQGYYAISNTSSPGTYYSIGAYSIRLSNTAFMTNSLKFIT